jgi:transposase
MAGAPVLVMAFLPRHSQAAYLIADSEPVRQAMADLEAGYCRQRSAEIWLDKDGHWYAGLTLVYPTESYEPKDWLGVDLGVVHQVVAATANGQHRLSFDGRGPLSATL